MQVVWSNLDLTRAVIGLIERTKKQEALIISRGNTIRVLTVDRYLMDSQGVNYTNSGVAKIDDNSRLNLVFGSKIYIPNFVETQNGTLIEITNLQIEVNRGVEIEAEWITSNGGEIRLNNPKASIRMPNCVSMASIEILNAERVEFPKLRELVNPLVIRRCKNVELSCGFDLTNASFLRCDNLKLISNSEGTIPNVPDQRNVNEDVKKLYIPHGCLGLNISDGTTLTSILQTYFGDDTEIIGY